MAIYVLMQRAAASVASGLAAAPGGRSEEGEGLLWLMGGGSGCAASWLGPHTGEEGGELPQM